MTQELNDNTGNPMIGDHIRIMSAQRRWDYADAYAGYEGIVTEADQDGLTIKGATSTLIVFYKILGNKFKWRRIKSS